MWFADRRAVRAALLCDRVVLVPPGGAARVCEAAPASSDAPPWRAPLTALLQGLKDAGLRGGALSLTLGTAFVRWQLVEWPLHAGSPAELDAAVRMRLRAVHGASVADWVIQHGDGVPGHPLLACAIDAPLLQALRLELPAAGWRLNHLRPYVAVAIEHWRTTWRRGAAWVAVVEPDHLTLALFLRGRCLGLRSVRCDERTWQSLLPGLQAPMALSAELPPSMPLYVIGAVETALLQPTWRALLPQGPAAQSERLARLAWGR